MTTENTGEVVASRLKENSGAESLLNTSMAWMETLYDTEVGLLRYPGDANRHMVRESLWYAFGLVLESRYIGNPDASLDRAATVIRSVLTNQYVAPGKIWHGTFKRSLEEGDASDDAVIWRDYDPNWRQFIGTVLLLLRRLEGDRSLASLLPEIDRALINCIEGEPVNRVPPTYTNIALMKAWLEIECADLFDSSFIRVDIRERGLAYALEIRKEFDNHRAFGEFNSPTYYGINFFALGLWQNFSEALANMGTQISTILWNDVSCYYHAGMKNLCGPWSRSYGMDMHQYVAALGLWIWAATNREVAPFPDSTDELEHGHDFCLGPIAAFSAVSIPEVAKARFVSFDCERSISQQISTTPLRKAYAYLSERLMVGLEISTRSFRGTDQYHPLTLHWLDADDQVNWCRLRFKGRLSGELQNNKIIIGLIADDAVTTARLEFSDSVQLEDQTIVGNALELHLETRCHLEVLTTGDLITGVLITLPDSDGEHSLTITCQVAE